MDIDKFHYLRSKLISEKTKALKALNNMENMEEYAHMDNYLNELSNYGNHPGDLGTETFMREQDEGFKNQLKELLFEIEDSLEDMKDGKYGLCKNCDAEIPTARLEILPYAKSCSSCSEKIHTEEKIYESLDDDYITKYRNNFDENTGYDREDVLQDILEYDIVTRDPSFSTGDYMGIARDEDLESMDDVENISQEYYDSTLK